MNPVRIGVIGCGGIAQTVHLPLLQRNSDRAALAALVELSPARLATLGDRYGVPEAARFTSLEDLLAALAAGTLPLDGAILATAGLHAGDAGRLLAAGLAVLAEKPLAYAASELDALEEAAAAGGIDLESRLRVGYMKEYDPAVTEARHLLAGLDVRAVSIEVLHPADHRQLAFAHLLPPALDLPETAVSSATAALQQAVSESVGNAPEEHRRLFASVLLGSVIHDIALLRHLGLPLGRPDRVTHSGAGFPGSLTASGTTLEGTVPWQLGWHFIADYPEYRETVTIHHEAGSLQLEFQTPYLLNAATRLTTEAASPGLGRVTTVRTWPQLEAFERELFSLLGLAAGRPEPGSSVAAARADLSTAVAFFDALTPSAGHSPDPVTTTEPPEVAAPATSPGPPQRKAPQ